ncbi:MAG TPA: 3-hydroxyacyl-CoA dehydrogenase NAD-binding domain-containing protein [Propionibacteriaceae bacterium]|nr:3-hydroxyacyl-CoA dehydrogenase NAD-binding domain-containing protein [Propionibacteriaceae bacterium]
MTNDLQDRIDSAVALAPDEVVTRALSRDVTLPYGAGTAVLITLDNGLDHKRPNTLGPRGLDLLRQALETARARQDISAIAVTGKPYILAAGADLTGVVAITEREQALAIAQIGHAVLDLLHDAPVPTFALVNGLALGGGLEVALHCDYRTMSSVASAVALPECFLGLLPGWGGAYLLPNLIGPDRAVTVIIENALNRNTMLSGPQAHALGIADALFEGADFLERSLDWVAQVVAGTVVVTRTEVDRGEAWGAAVARGKAYADTKVFGAAPAPYRALELIAAAETADRYAAYAAEDEALADLIMSQELRSGLYAFDLVQKRARRPAGAPDQALASRVTKVGIVGAGLMATQLALLFVRRLEVPVVLSDVDQARVDAGLETVRREIETLKRKGRVTADQANRLGALVSGSVDLAAFRGCDFVLEAVFEDLTVKRQVFTDLEQHVSPSCVLASNTSSLSISELAHGLTHPRRVIGFHFFNPVAVLPLLEVVRGHLTDDATLATALAVSKALKKNAVLVRDAPGFVVNRLLTRWMGEVLAAVDEGTPIAVADAALRPLGLPLPPLVLLQLVGPAIALHVAETLHAKLGDRFAVSPNLRALVAANKPGIYDWTAEGKPYVSEETQALLQVGDRPSTADEVRLRALSALTEEIGLLLAEEVVAAPMDVDLCLILGAGWPFHLGGITPYLDREQISTKVLGRTFLPPGVATLPISGAVD